MNVAKTGSECGPTEDTTSAAGSEKRRSSEALVAEKAGVPPRTRLRKERMILGALVLSGLVLLAIGWGLATIFQSSAQREASQAPPPSSPILSTVTSGNLVRQTSFSATLVPEKEESLVFAAPTGAARSVVTGHPVTRGTDVVNGQMLTEVNGRPVMVVLSVFPFYRDIGFGASGPDVVAVQDMLRTLGYEVETDGLFGAQTEQAVRAWYALNGYAAATQPDGGATSSSSSTSESGRDRAQAISGAGTGRDAEAAYLPLSELLGVTTLPAVALTELPTGSDVGKPDRPDVVLGTKTTKVVFTASPAALVHVAQGEEVQIETNGVTVRGEVARIDPGGISESSLEDGSTGGETGTQTSASKTTVTVTPSEPLEGSSGEIRVVSSQIIVDQVALLVPTIAVIDRGDGNQVVALSRGGREFIEIAVTVLGALDGRSAVLPVDASALRDGDEVRVGNT